MNSSPARRGQLTAEEICDYVDQAARATGVHTIIFAGGEPLLLGEHLFRSLEHVRSKKMRSRIVTNAYWANSVKRAEEITRRLRDSGLDEINISVDDFHLPFINADNVKRAFDAAMLLDFESIIIVHCTGPTTKFNDEQLDELLGVKLPRLYDEEMNRRSDTLTGEAGRPYVAVSNSSLQYIGRATTELESADIPWASDWEKVSRQLGGCPWAVRSPAISPAGRLLSCCGFEVAGNDVLDIGDLREKSLEELLRTADNDLPLNMIALDGPYRIMDFLKEQEPDLPFREKYSSFCELCQHMVTDERIKKSFLEKAHLRAPQIVALREAALDRLREEDEFEALYHASDPVS